MVNTRQMIVQDVQYIYEFDMAEGVSTFENGKFKQSLSSDYVWKRLFEFGTSRNKILEKGYLN